MRRTVTTRLAVTAIAALALASCGSSSKSSSTKTKDTSATTASSQSTTTGVAKAPASAALVTAKKDKKLGTLLADAKGMTLYTLTNNGKAVTCSGPCLGAWPPLVSTGSSAPKGSAGITGLSTVMGPDGIHLVAVNGLPLYHFVKDKDAGDAYGEGLKSFGGVWHVSKTSATPSAPAGQDNSSTQSTTTEPTTSSNGY